MFGSKRKEINAYLKQIKHQPRTMFERLLVDVDNQKIVDKINYYPDLVWRSDIHYYTDEDIHKMVDHKGLRAGYSFELSCDIGNVSYELSCDSHGLHLRFDDSAINEDNTPYKTFLDINEYNDTEEVYDAIRNQMNGLMEQANHFVVRTTEHSVFVLGSINMDLVFEVDRMPVQGETVSGKKFFMTPGGKGANQAVACSRQGVTTTILGSVGTDALSETCIDALQDSGVNTEHLTIIEDDTCGVAGIFLEQGDNRIVIDAGANAIQDMEKWKRVLIDYANDNDILLSQLEIPISVVMEVFGIAKSLGLYTVLNATPVQALPLALYEYIDLLVVNEVELSTLTNEQNPDLAVKGLLRKGVKAVLLTQGEKGGVYFDDINEYRVDAYPVDAVDTTAAGDTYIGAFVSQIIQDVSVQKAMEYAAKAAAIAVTKYGAQTSIPTVKDVQSFTSKGE